MKQGSLVIMVRDIKTPLSEEEKKIGVVYPVKGKIYTVRDVESLGGTMYLTLEEIKNPLLHYEDGYGELSFDSEYFVEILPPIEIVKFIEENTIRIPSVKELIKLAEN